jgi:hypothetical protein
MSTHVPQRRLYHLRSRQAMPNVHFSAFNPGAKETMSVEGVLSSAKQGITQILV